MPILAWHGLAVKLHLAEALRQAVARPSNAAKHSVHQDKHHHPLNMPSPPLPTPRLHPLPGLLAHALRVQHHHPPRPTVRATPPPAPGPLPTSRPGCTRLQTEPPWGHSPLCQSKYLNGVGVFLFCPQKARCAKAIATVSLSFDRKRPPSRRGLRQVGKRKTLSEPAYTPRR